MADGSTQEQIVRIKQEAKDLSETKAVPRPPQPVASTWAPSRVTTGPGQQKITQYFGNNKHPPPGETNPDDESDRKTPPLDIDSLKGVFGWTSFGSVHIPYILRKGEKYAAVRMIEGKLLKKFLQALPPDVYSCTYIKSYFITENESKLLNEINSHHCVYQFGYEQFTPKDLVVPLDDARNFYEFLETCYNKLINPTSQESNISRCGFIKLNGTVVPYVKRDGLKYVPLSFFEQELEELKMKAEKLESWELSYLKFCCKVAGLDGDLLNNQSCPVVSVETVKEFSEGRVCLEDWWPSQNKNFGGLSLLQKANSVPGKNSSDINLPSSIFQAPDAVLPNGLFSKGPESTTKLELPLKQGPGTSISVTPTVTNSVLPSKPNHESLVIVTSQQPAIPQYQSSQGMPTFASVPWNTTPQPLVFNGQWWRPVDSHMPTSVASQVQAKSDAYLPTVIPGPNFTFEKFLQQLHSASNSPMQPKTTEALLQSLNRADTSSASSVKITTTTAPPILCTDTNQRNQTTSRPPPPLVKIHETSVSQPVNVNGLRLPTASSAPTFSGPMPGEVRRITSVATGAGIQNSSSAIQRVTAQNQNVSFVASQDVRKHGMTIMSPHTVNTQRSESTLDAANSQNLRLLSVSQWNSVSEASQNSALFGRHITSLTENMVVAPGVHLSSIKQTSPKPANPVPSVNSGGSNHMFARPPPPLIPTNGITVTPVTPTPVGSIVQKLPTTSYNGTSQDQLHYHRTSLSDSGSLTNVRSATKRPFPDRQQEEQRRAFRLQMDTVDGKELRVINMKPHIHNDAKMASLEDIVTTFFPNITVSSCQHVLSEVLGVSLYECNSLQLEALSHPQSGTVVKVEDLLNYMPQLKYMFARLDCRGSSTNDSPSLTSHTSKRIRL